MNISLTERYILYFKSQIKFFMILSFFTILPIGIYLLYSPFKIPYLEYAFVGVIVLTQYFYFNESQYKKSIESSIKDYLRKKNNKLPSQKHIYKLTKIYLSGRSLAIGVNILLIIIFSIVMK